MPAKPPLPPCAAVCATMRPGPETDLLNLAAMAALEDASWTQQGWAVSALGPPLRPAPQGQDGKTLRIALFRITAEQVNLHRQRPAGNIRLLRHDAARIDTVRIIESSCYDALTQLPAGSIDAVITSPPYANRYDYTRTYALELAWLGYDNRSISELRQRLLSATVENRSKRAQLSPNHSHALALFDPSSGHCRNH